MDRIIDYADYNSNRITDIEKELRATPINKAITLMKEMNKQIEVLAYKIKVLEKKINTLEGKEE